MGTQLPIERMQNVPREYPLVRPAGLPVQRLWRVMWFRGDECGLVADKVVTFARNVV